MSKIATITFFLIAMFIIDSDCFAQPGGKYEPSKMSIGRLYGKIVDENGEGLSYATVQLTGKTFDKITKSPKDTLYAGQLTEDNGDFNLENLPVMGDFTLKISYLGYKELSQNVDFGMKAPQGQGSPHKPNMGGFPGGGDFEKDLGNIKLVTEASELSEVTVTTKVSATTLALDRKSYKIDKDLTTAGGSAQDALKNVPSLTVDIDGNVSLRNGQPQIFVDGKPTSLSLDQIAASTIESIEVITNPSSKFDSGGGNAGIVNIVLKKENRVGYNGNLRVGGDSKYGYNLSGDINLRGSKLNFFASASHNRNKGNGIGETFRHNLVGDPLSDVTQTTSNIMNGRFTNARTGFDYFIDNRNTITISGSLVKGAFKPMDEIHSLTEYFYSGKTEQSNYVRMAKNNRNFRNLGIATQFKHNYIKKGKELTADLAYNKIKFIGGSDYITDYHDAFLSLENQAAVGKGEFLTAQTDYVNPLSDKTKIEMGVKATLRTNQNDNMNSYLDNVSGSWIPRSQLTDHYKYVDDVFAAYFQSGFQLGSWGIQSGLRAEGSYYHGELIDRDSSFTIAYPFALFPSLFVTKKIDDSRQFQLSYTRRVLRPNFFQTLPFTDFTDSLNLRRGNPGLKPEFTNSLEASFQKIFEKGHNFLATLYFKQSSNTITNYQFEEYNSDLGKTLVITSFENGKKAYAYGLELTLKSNFFKKLDLTTNINVFQSKIDATNVENNLDLSRTAAIIKETIQLGLGKGFTFQANGEYKSKASFTPITNNDPFGGGGGRGQQQNSAQGYSKAFWYTDLSLSKTLFKNNLTATLSVQDVFKTRKQGSYYDTDFYTQDSYRINNPQLVRLNLAYKFGKMDLSLFKRKNNRVTNQGGDMMGG